MCNKWKIFSVILAHIDGVFSTYFYIKLTNLENQSVSTALLAFSTYGDIKTITRKTSRISNQIQLWWLIGPMPVGNL